MNVALRSYDDAASAEAMDMARRYELRSVHARCLPPHNRCVYHTTDDGRRRRGCSCRTRRIFFDCSNRKTTVSDEEVFKPTVGGQIRRINKHTTCDRHKVCEASGTTRTHHLHYLGQTTRNWSHCCRSAVVCTRRSVCPLVGWLATAAVLGATEQ